MISIIVPVYNVADCLEKCVYSLLGQTYSDIEVILVDDGSADSSEKMCDTLSEQDSRVKVIHKKNGGLSSARNVGLDFAKGEYICFVDSDDWVEADYCEKLVKNMEADGSDISVCAYFEEYAEQTSVKAINRESPLCSAEARSLLEKREAEEYVFTVVAWNKMYKRSIFENLRYIQGKLHEDEFIIHRLLGKSKLISVVGKPLYHYVRRENSITGKENVNDIRHLDVLEAFEDRIIYFMEIKDVKNASVAWRNYMLTIIENIENRNFSQTETAKLKKCYREAFRTFSGLIPFKLKLKYSLYRYVPGVYKMLFPVRKI